MKNKYLWMLTALLLLWCGCDEPEPVVPTPPPAKEATYVKMATTSVPTFEAQGGEASVTFETDGAWTAKVGATWCSVSPTQGKAGTVTLKVVVKANTSYEERTTKLVVNAGKVTKTLQLKQEAQEKPDEPEKPEEPEEPESYLKVKTDSFDVAWNGEMIRIDVEANVDYTVVMPQVEWMYEETSLNDGTGHHYILVTPNESYEPRSAEIVVRNEDKELADTVYVTQEAQEKPETYLRVQNKHFNVAWTGEIIRFDIETNVDYTLVAPDVDWLYEAPEYIGRIGYHFFMVTPNESYETRSAEIVVRNEAEGLADTVYVTQAAQEKPESYLRFNGDRFDAGWGGAIIEFGVETNVDYTLIVPGVGWLYETLEFGGGVASRYHHIVVTPNESYETRSAEIIIVNEAEGVADTAYVTQTAQERPEPVLSIARDQCIVSAEGESLEVGVYTNIDYTLKMPEVSWLIEGEGSTPDRRIFVVAPNEGYDERSAEVVFANEQYGVSSTLLVTQEAKALLELISADKIELKASARSFELKIRANGEPQVTSNADWLSLKSQSQGDNYERTYVFDVDAEQAGAQRYATIQIYHKSLYLTVEVELKSVDGNGGIDDMPEHPL